jgi:hypothetical protein
MPESKRLINHLIVPFAPKRALNVQFGFWQSLLCIFRKIGTNPAQIDFHHINRADGGQSITDFHPIL